MHQTIDERIEAIAYKIHLEQTAGDPNTDALASLNAELAKLIAAKAAVTTIITAAGGSYE